MNHLSDLPENSHYQVRIPRVISASVEKSGIEDTAAVRRTLPENLTDFSRAVKTTALTKGDATLNLINFLIELVFLPGRS